MSRTSRSGPEDAEPRISSCTAAIIRCHGRVRNDCRIRAPPSGAVARSRIAAPMIPSYAAHQLSRITVAICAASAVEADRITIIPTKLANPQREEEVHLVIKAGQVAPGQLLD